jgi:lysophospholipase
MFAPLLLSFLLVTTQVLATYVPQSAICPTTSLVRPANGLSDNEEAYRVTRKAIADQALKAWLHKTNSGFSTTDQIVEN